jgi:hypothetical protein
MGGAGNAQRSAALKRGRLYASGHQTYADPKALREMKADLERFYAAALAGAKDEPRP